MRTCNMRIFPRNIKRVLKSSLFGLILAAAMTVQAFGAAGETAQDMGRDTAKDTAREADREAPQDTLPEEGLTASPITMDVVYGYKNIAKSGRFLPLRVDLKNTADRAFTGTLCVLAMESDLQGYSMDLDYDVYRYEYPVEIPASGSVTEMLSVSLGARVDMSACWMRAGTRWGRNG